MLAELSDRQRAHVFFGAARSELLKVQESLSRRSWADLVEAWRGGEGHGPNGIYVDHLVEVFERLLFMGLLGPQGPEQTIEEQVPQPALERPEAYWAQKRLEAKGRANAAAEETRVWLERELPD